jgi:hypothetical protein
MRSDSVTLMIIRGFVALSLFAALAQAENRVPVVVELFTSEGCSSCPPADALLTKLDGVITSREFHFPSNLDVIVLEEHVDYWDGLGWKDRFSSPLFSARQQDYGIALGAATVYTPQAIVNGSKEALGSDPRALSRAILQAGSTPQASIELRVLQPGSAQESLFMKVGRLPIGSHRVDVLLAVAESNIETNVGAGENSGRKLRHTAVVRSLSRLAELDPSKPGEYSAEAKLNLRDDWKRPNVKIVVLVQDRQTRKILGAATVKL